MSDSFQLKAIITGVDKLSPMTAKMSRNYQKAIKQMEAASQAQREAAAQTVGRISVGAVAAMTAVTAAYAKQETAATDLKTSMMDASGNVSVNYQKLNALALELGNKLPGTTADFQNMMETLVKQGIPAEQILSGVGKAAAYTAVQLHMMPTEAAQDMAALKNATGATAKQMLTLADMAQRASYMGVGLGDTVTYFAKVSPTLKMISSDATKAARALEPLSVMMSHTKMDPGSAGIAAMKGFQGAMNAKKMNQVNRHLAKSHIHLEFFRKGKFLGVENFVSQIEKLKQLNPQQQALVMKKIWGQDAETLSYLTQVMNEGLAGYRKTQKAMDDQATLNQRVNASLDTLTNNLDAMKGSAENAAASVGKVFAPQIKGITKDLNDFAVSVDDATTKYPKATREIGDMAMSVVGLGIAIKGVKMAMGMLALNPYTATILALAAAAGYLIANKDELSQIAGKNGKTSKTAAAAAKDPIVTRSKHLYQNANVTPLAYDPFGFNQHRNQASGGVGVFTAGGVNTLIPYGLADKVSAFRTDVGNTAGQFPYVLNNWRGAPVYDNGVNTPTARMDPTQIEVVVRLEGAQAGSRPSINVNGPAKAQLDVGYSRFSPNSLMRGNY